MTITSKASLEAADALGVIVKPSSGTKCDRCWHYRDDIGLDEEHPTICGRCTGNLYGKGDPRRFA